MTQTMLSLSRDGLAAFDEVAASHVSDERLPGLVALVACADQVHVRTVGSLSVGGPPVRRDSLFRIASTTKPVIGAATLALVQEGLLGLDEPVDRLLPELANRRVLRRLDGPITDTVPARRAITVRDLLTFTNGFGMDVGMVAAAEPWPVLTAVNQLPMPLFGPPQPAEQPDPDTWINALGSLPLLAQPGQRWFYNTGAQVLGVLLARAAGTSLDEVLTTRLFAPLGMSDTGFWTADTERLATAYAANGDGLDVWDTPGGQWSSPPAFEDGAAGLVSTVDDLLTFARMLLRGGEPVLSQQAVRQMTRDQLTAEQKAHASPEILDVSHRTWGFAQSVITEGQRAGAFGWDGGLGTSWLVDPARELTVIVLTQRLFETPQPPQVHTDLQAAAYAAVRVEASE